MGWLWLVGSLKWQVSFAKEPYKRDDIMQKRPVILRSLLIVATPYRIVFAHMLQDVRPYVLSKFPYRYYMSDPMCDITS